MKLSQKSLAVSSTGKLVTLISSELQIVEKSFWYIPYIFTGIFIFGVAFWIFGYHFKEAAVIAFGALLLIILIVMVLNFLMFGVIYKASHYSDLRIKMITDLINGIKTIKAYCWETIFYQKVKHYRDLQYQNMKNTAYLMSLAVPFLFWGGYILGSVLIGYHWGTGNKIEYSSAILLLTYWVYFSISVFPSFFNGIYQNFKLANILRRVDEVMNKDEFNETDHELDESEYPDTWVLMKHATVSYSFKIEQDKYTGEKEVVEDQTTDNLFDINFMANTVDFISIVGPVGSGKTTFLVAILKELEVKQGKIRIRGRISYVEQEPFILSETVRNNILFGHPYDESKFNEVLEIWCLDEDVKQLKDGIDTKIGERGINISGDQKARISLARAVYSDSDIYLLDDPLSALDPQVGK